MQQQLWIFALVLLGVKVSAQQLPNKLYQPGSENFNFSNAFIRQDVCDRQDKVHNGSIESLANALEGLELHTIIVPTTEGHFKTTESGAIDTDYPGLMGIILDEIASRAKFKWRDTYAIGPNTPDQYNNKTWTQVLEWSAYNYDLSATWWTHSVDRLKLGADFPRGWYDASIIMVGAKTTKRQETEFELWSFLYPFTGKVWALIIGTVIISGIIYWLLENIDHKTDKRRLQKNIFENVFLAGITFTSHFEFMPRSNAARLFTFSLSFWALIVGAAYTANLASVLVASNRPTIKINSIDDAINMQYPMCVLKTAQADISVSEAYPNAILVRKVTEEEVYMGVNKGDCKLALTTVRSWDTFSRDDTVNGDCNLDSIGRVVLFLNAGFATWADSGTFCTSIISDVINIHVMQLEKEGFIQEAWDDYLQRIATVDCMARSNANDGDETSYKLGLKSMGGIFIFHYMLSFAAIIIAIIYKCTGWDSWSKGGPMSREAIRQSSSDAESRRRKTFKERVRNSFVHKQSPLYSNNRYADEAIDPHLDNDHISTSSAADNDLSSSYDDDDGFDENMAIAGNNVSTEEPNSQIASMKKEICYELSKRQDQQMKELVKNFAEMKQIMMSRIDSVHVGDIVLEDSLDQRIARAEKSYYAFAATEAERQMVSSKKEGHSDNGSCESFRC